MKLTAAGVRLFEKADELTELWSEVLQSAKRDNDEAAGLIRIGCHTAVAQYTPPLFLPTFLEKYPSITVQLQHGLSRHMNEAIVSDRLDVGFVVNPSLHPDLVIKEIFKDIVTLWKSKKLINPDALIYDPDLVQTQKILKKLNKKGFSFKRHVESSSLEVISQLVVAGAGYGILPERVVEAFGKDQVSNPKDAPFFSDRICLVFKPSFRSLKRGQALIGAFK